MVKVVEVAPDWTPPDGETFAVVEVARSGTAYFAEAVRQIEDRARLFRANNGAGDIANAIDEARQWATHNGAAVVYVVRPDGFAR